MPSATTSFRARVKIYGSDADEDAIRQARLGRYPADALEGAFTPDQIERYFEASGTERVFRKDLRRCVVFGRHDLVQDPPISRIDLLVCRNTLMYLNADVQRQVLESFHFALDDGGFLFLGRSEALVTRTDLFSVDDLTHHVFVKDTPRRGPVGRRPPRSVAATPRPTTRSDGALLEAAFESGALAQVRRRSPRTPGAGQPAGPRALRPDHTASWASPSRTPSSPTVRSSCGRSSSRSSPSTAR